MGDIKLRERKPQVVWDEQALVETVLGYLVVNDLEGALAALCIWNEMHIGGIVLPRWDKVPSVVQAAFDEHMTAEMVWEMFAVRRAQERAYRMWAGVHL